MFCLFAFDWWKIIAIDFLSSFFTIRKQLSSGFLGILYISPSHFTCSCSLFDEPQQQRVGFLCSKAADFTRVPWSTVQRTESERFMSSGFELGFVRALLQQLWIPSASLIFSVVAALCCMLFCSTGQSLNLVKPAVSMRLRPKRFVAFAPFPKSRIISLLNLSSSWISRIIFSFSFFRTCSGVECFGGFHIQQYSNPFLFLRGDLT